MILYNQIQASKKAKKKLLAILIDPDKIEISTIGLVSKKINQSPATHIFIGGSTFIGDQLDEIILKLKLNVSLPVILFPGNLSQISDKADGILFLSLISGRNSDYLIEHHVNAAPILKKTNLEVISTGYLLIESGRQTAVEHVSQTVPLSRLNPNYILQTAQAGEMLGNKLIYLEAGSGADLPVPEEIITLLSGNIEIPLIVGGGIQSLSEIEKAFKAGADLIVIGTAFENNINFFES